MKRSLLSIIVLLSLCNLGMAEQRVAPKRPASQTPTSQPAGPAIVARLEETPDAQPRAKVVEVGHTDIVRVNAKVRYTTLIVLPQDERILDFTSGDKEFWIVNGAENVAYVKPAKAGGQTNLNLVTASGRIYSFLLQEVSESSQSAPDLKVFVERKDDEAPEVASGTPRFVSVKEVEDYRQQVESAQEETRRVKESAQTVIDKGISQFISNVRFPYRFEAGKKPFFVRAIYTDDKFTFLQARPEETPALYEMKDGKPNIVNFRYENGVYVVEKVLDRGYLAIGKEKLSFRRED